MTSRTARARMITTVAAPVLGTLGHTWRATRSGLHHHDALVAGKQPFVYAFPHGRVLLGAVLHRRQGIHILISTHADGEIAAWFVRRFGFQSVRGSSTRGGMKSLLELCRMDPEAKIGIPVDGPKGPEGRAKQGIVQLARLGQRTILPVGMAASRAWRLRSWDRLVIPKPFARVAIVYGEPIELPAELAKDRIDEWRQVVDRALLAADDEAWRLVENHDPGARLPPIS